jgi:hypothetical protein
LCFSTDTIVYGFTYSDDTHGTLTQGAAAGGARTNFLGTSGTYTSFNFVPQSSTKCGTSLSVVCQLDDYNGRNLISRYWKLGAAWLYATQTFLSTDKAIAQQILNKTQAGSPVRG